MNQPSAPSDVRRERYATPGRGRRIRLWAAIAALMLGALAWVTWAALGAADADVRSRIIGFRALDDRRVLATLEVVADPAATVTCRLRAQNRHHETTGVARVVMPAGSTDRRVVRRVMTTRDRAVVVTVVGCRVE